MRFPSVSLILLIFCCQLILGRQKCDCMNGGKCARNGLCRCKDGYFGDLCEFPCVDIYNSCVNWKEQGRCFYGRGTNRFFLENCPVSCQECVYNPDTVPEGIPLAPVLVPLKLLIGKWQAETPYPDRYPVSFSSNSSGYKEIIHISVAKLPGFDTPFLNYSAIATSYSDKTDIQKDLGFLWMKPSRNNTRQVANMFTTNSGLTIIQEGYLSKNVIKFNTTTYSEMLPGSILSKKRLGLDATRLIKFTARHMVQVLIGKDKSFYQKIYDRIG